MSERHYVVLTRIQRQDAPKSSPRTRFFKAATAASALAMADFLALAAVRSCTTLLRTHVRSSTSTVHTSAGVCHCVLCEPGDFLVADLVGVLGASFLPPLHKAGGRKLVTSPG